jgi:23S rRNA pseudouridine1911/1915/1917 synthase
VAEGAARIVRRLAREKPGVAASRLKRAVLDGQVTVDGSVVDDPGALVPDGAAVVWDPNRQVRRRVRTSLAVLHEDADSVAVFKPAGLLTHPTEAAEKDTLLSRVSAYVARRARGRGGAGGSGGCGTAGSASGAPTFTRGYVAVVHRLDKETSGILVFATSRRGLVSLQSQLRAHTMERVYLAVVEGSLAAEKGVFDAPIVADRGDRRRGIARDGETGLAAVTEWCVVERFGAATLVEARLKTGRTHQVRVHFAEAGHPLVGDRVYRDPKRPPFPNPFPRQALHAGRLGFTTPEGERVVLEAPMPEDMSQLLEVLRRRTRTPGAGSRGSPSTRGRR